MNEDELIEELIKAFRNSTYGRPHEYGRFVEAYIELLMYAVLPLFSKIEK